VPFFWSFPHNPLPAAGAIFELFTQSPSATGAILEFFKQSSLPLPARCNFKNNSFSTHKSPAIAG
jgi:hypothetical protein